MVLMYGTFCYKGLLRIPWVAESVYELAKADNQVVEAEENKEKVVYLRLDRDDDQI